MAKYSDTLDWLSQSAVLNPIERFFALDEDETEG